MQGLLVASVLGADATLNRFLPQFTGEDSAGCVRSVFWRFLGVRLTLLGALGAVGVAVSAVIALPLASSIGQYALLLIFLAAIRATTQLMGVALVASFRPATNAIVTASVRVGELVALLLLAPRGLSIQLVLELFLSTGCLQIFSLLFFGRTILVGRWSKVAIAPVLSFGMIFWVNSVSDFFLGRFGDLFFLSMLLPGKVPASLYDVASSLNQAALLATTAGFAGVSLARLARLAATEPDAMNTFYRRLVRVVSLLTVPLFAFLFFHGEQVVELLYSSSFVGAGSILQILVFYRLGSRLFAGGENTEYLLSKGKVAPFVGVGLLAALVNIALDLILIPPFEAHGAAWASCVANLTANALAWYLVRRSGGPQLQALFWAKLVAICCLSSWLAGLISGGMLLLTVIAYVILALLIAWFLKPLCREDREVLAGVHPLLARVSEPFASGVGWPWLR
jgi:O-antigen/teichoic acid export membrane protein